MPADGTTFDRALQEYGVAMGERIRRSLDMIGRMMTPEEREAQRQRAAELEERTERVPIEDVRAGDEVELVVPDMEGYGHEWVKVIETWPIGPVFDPPRFPVVVLIEGYEGPEWAPVHERGEMVRRRRPVTAPDQEWASPK